MKSSTTSKKNESTEPNTVSSIHSSKKSDEILAYWTDERMKSAAPVNIDHELPNKSKKLTQKLILNAKRKTNNAKEKK